MSDVATNPELDLEPVEEPEVAPAETEEVVEGEETPPEMVEVEIDGQTHSVPAALKDSFLKSADYTQKTQELAEQRRQAEETLGKSQADFVQQVQAQRQNLAMYGQLNHVEDQLDQLSKVDMAALYREDPDQAQQLGFHRESLRDQRDKLQDDIEKQEHDLRVNAEREHATRKDQLETTLARDIPNYTSELRAEMNQTALDNGYTEQEVASVTDPRLMKMLHLAHLGAQVLKRQTATPKPKLVKPVSKVTGGSSPDKGPTDQQSTDAWMKRRNSQVRAR